MSALTGVNPLTESLLKTHLEVCVPIRVDGYLDKGGPDEVDFGRIRNIYPWKIGSQGDALLYRAAGVTAEIIDMVVDGLAVLSFCLGGVTAFGLHFETAKPEEATETPVSTK